MLAFVWRKSETCKWHPIPTALFDISGPILRLSRVNRPGLRKLWSATELYEVEEGIPPQILRKQAKGNFGKSKQATFCAKQTNFAQTGHTRRRAELCVVALQVDSLSTCCECQKRDRAKLSFVILYKTGFIALSRFCHSQQVLKESACSAATHNSARRRVWPVCAKFVCFAQKVACFDLPKFPLAYLRKKMRRNNLLNFV